jgi:D-alanine-D-alanine ligase
VTPPARKTAVLVLAGGPDAEREVSLVSARCVADALATDARFEVRHEPVGRLDAAALAALPGDVVFPVLHGPFGEGGPMQDLLEAGGRPYVGCGPRAARLAMDKAATKLAALRLGIPTAEAAIFNPADDASPLGLPVVLKPVHEGSSVGLHICRDGAQWDAARGAVLADLRGHPHRVYLLERAIERGRELTVGLLDGRPLAPIEIRPAAGVYDYQAKYHRDDTRYDIAPALPAGVTERIQAQAAALAAALGVRHLARVDFILDPAGVAWLLEINTMPGFTTHSLLPMAALHAGLPFAALCAKLVDLALRDGPRPAARLA